MNYTLHCAEVVRWSELYIGKKFHAVMCDPPYGLGFMDKDWDEAVHSKEWGEALIPILYPGALVFMFGGTRTWHKLATGMEAAGFEILDTLMWIHGSGFPKAQSIDKQLDDESGADRTPIMETKRDLFGEFEQEKKRTDGAGNTGDETVPFAPPSSKNYSVTEPSEAAAPWAGHKTPALKPAWEPIIMFRAPREGYSYGQLAEKFGSGCLNTDGARIETREKEQTQDYYNATSIVPITGGRIGGKIYPADLGRYPANLILDLTSAEMMDEQTKDKIHAAGYATPGVYRSPSLGPVPIAPGGWSKRLGDSGGASRFFYCAKASRDERDAGLKGFELQAFGQSGGSQQALAEGKDEYLQEGHIGLNRIKMIRNPHPTVKPISLICWLAKLLLPPDTIKPRRLLVPFAGSGSEMIGAIQAGWDEVEGIEESKEFCKIAQAQLDYWAKLAVQINMFE